MGDKLMNIPNDENNLYALKNKGWGLQCAIGTLKESINENNCYIN